MADAFNPQTTVKVSADLEPLKKEFDAGLVHFKQWARTIEVSNKQMVADFRSTGEELRVLGDRAKVSTDQAHQLTNTIDRVESAVDRLHRRQAVGFESMSRGLAMMERSGQMTGRSMNALLAG
jgi:hypothetical protein